MVFAAFASASTSAVDLSLYGGISLFGSAKDEPAVARMMTADMSRAPEGMRLIFSVHALVTDKMVRPLSALGCPATRTPMYATSSAPVAAGECGAALPALVSPGPSGKRHTRGNGQDGKPACTARPSFHLDLEEPYGSDRPFQRDSP